MPDDGRPPPQQEGAQNQTLAVEERDLARICLDVISSTILRPTKTYFNRLEEIETDLSLKKLHFEAETEDTAAATKARLDLEASATPELVRDGGATGRPVAPPKPKKFRSQRGLNARRPLPPPQELATNPNALQQQKLKATLPAPSTRGNRKERTGRRTPGATSPDS